MSNMKMWGLGAIAVCAWLAVSVRGQSTGLIAAWGSNDHGQCNVSAPNAGFVAIAGGGDHSLGLRADGSIAAWGLNVYGQCNVSAPNMAFVAVAAGNLHSLGLRADGSIAAWGHNLEGQCNVPAPNAGFVAVEAGFAHSVGLRADGSIAAWGWNVSGQCNVPGRNAGFVAVAGGGSHSLGLRADGSIVAWGANNFGQCNVPAPNAGFVAIAAGGAYSLGLKADGSIAAWGDNRAGQRNVPVPNAGFVAIAAGGSHSLGLKADGSIAAWGDNRSGQLNVPGRNAGFVAVAGGGRDHSLALFLRQVWAEQGDAGDLAGTAQGVTGSGPLHQITGVITVNDVDMYRIKICDEANFTASTVGGAAWDTQLWLFNLDGTGRAMNDDHVGGTTLQSALSSTFVTANGEYYLAISAYDRDATSGGAEMWMDLPFRSERAPDGPGATNPVDGWGGTAAVGGAYAIYLTGCEFIPYFCEPFDYPVGGLHGLGGWFPWAGAAPDGMIVAAPAGSTSGSNALRYVAAMNDNVHHLGFTSGKFYVSALTYVPGTAHGDGYIILCNAYANGGVGTSWASQVKFSGATDLVRNDAGGFGRSKTRPLIRDQWVRWEGMIDLANDTFHDVYDGMQLTFSEDVTPGVIMKWTDNALNAGGAGSPPAIAAVALYSAGIDGMFVDDFVVTCAADLDQSTGCGVLDVFDFLEFSNKYAASNPIACNWDLSTGPGHCDMFDFLHFLSDFYAGCGCR